MPAPIYLPPNTAGKDLQNTIMQIIQMQQMRKEQKQKDASMQLTAIMEMGGDPGALQKAMEGIGFNPQQAASYTESITDKETGQILSRDARKVMTEIKSIRKRKQAEAEAKAETADLDIATGAKITKAEARAKAEAGREVQPITTATELERLKVIGSEETKQEAEKEKARIQTRLDMAPEARKVLADDLREQAKTNEEMAKLYYKPQMERELDKLRRTKKIDFDFEAQLRAIPPGETKAHKALVTAQIREKNATADWIERGGKDKTTFDKYTEVLKFAAASGLVETNPKTKMQVIKAVPKNSVQHETIKQYFNDVGLDYEEIDVPSFVVPLTGGFSLGKPKVRIVPKPKANITKSSPGAMRLKSKGKSTHPLSGRKAGRYKVDGKIIKWDGTKEI